MKDESTSPPEREPILLSVTEAAKLLGISIPTFRSLRNDPSIRRLEIKIGKRIKFSKQALIDHIAGLGDESVPWEIPTGQLAIVSTRRHIQLEVEEGLFDLRGIEYVDPYGTLSLLAHLIGRSRDQKETKLLHASTNACKKLKHVGFFNYLDEFAPMVEWDRTILEGEKYFPPDSLLPITLLQRTGEERRAVERLNTLFVQQGFSAEIGGYTGWLLGELADNSMTHGGRSISDGICFIQAQRYTIGENSKCVVIGIADLGQGIHNSLRSNPKHATMSDIEATLSAFRSKYSAWGDEYNRGKGLSDILSIAMGNKSLLRASTGDVDIELDFQVHNKHKIVRVTPPLFKTKGTRFGFLYIDHEFKKKTREEADDYLVKEIAKL